MITAGSEHSRTQWRLDCFDAIAAFADQELQELAWRAPTSNPHWSYVEFMTKWHSELWLESGSLTAEEAALLDPLLRALSDYVPPNDDPYDVEAILADPEWAAVVAEARQARDKLSERSITEDERAALRGDLSWQQLRSDLGASAGTRH